MEITGFEHLHLHSIFSELDGYGNPEEYSKRAKEINQRFLTISDHGVMGAVPRQIRACEADKIFPIHACELYVNAYQPEPSDKDNKEYAAELDSETKKKFGKNCHLLAIAYNNIGYSNLVKLTSWGWLKGFYKRPRVNHQQLMKYKEGIIFTSCCYNGEIGWAFDQEGEEAAFAMVEKYMAMFGDKFYLELMLLDFKKQKPFDAFLIKAHNKYKVPLLITNDVHYCMQADAHMQKLLLLLRGKHTLSEINALAEQDADLFELQDQNLWMKSEDEINQKWKSDYSDVIDYELFKEAKRNTVRICEFAKGVELDRTMKLPKFDQADDKLWDAIIEGYKKRDLPRTKEYGSRIREEYDLIKQKDFSSYFLLQKMISDEARRVSPLLLGYGDGSEAMGAARGSIGGSLVAFCLGIIDVDPIKHDLLFSRFMSPARGGKTLKIRFSSEPIKQLSERIDVLQTGSV